MLARVVQQADLLLVDVADPAQPKPLGAVAAGSPADLAFSPDGRTLATASGSPVLWDVTDPTRPVAVEELTEHSSDTSAVVFDRGGHGLVTASNDPRNPTALLWNTGDLPEVVARATELVCAAVGPGFTEQEWEQYARGLPYQQLCP
jgi:hypothetical protein